MEINFELISGILGGSIVTLIGKEIINQVNKRQDFNRELKKITYERKLEVAEKATGYYWSYLGNVATIKKSLELILKAATEIDDTTIDLETVSRILENSGKNLEKLESTGYLEVSSVNLYFDLEDSRDWNENDLGNFYEAIAETKKYDLEIGFWTNLQHSYEEKGEDEQAVYCRDEMKKVLPKYIESLSNLIERIEKNRLASFQIASRLKKQFRRY